MEMTEHAATLARHDAEISELRNSMSQLAKAVETGFRDTRETVEHLAAAVQRTQATAWPPILETVKAGCQVLMTLVVTATAFGAIVLFLARGVSNRDYAPLESRLQGLEARVSVLAK